MKVFYNRTDVIPPWCTGDKTRRIVLHDLELAGEVIRDAEKQAITGVKLPGSMFWLLPLAVLLIH